MLCYDRIYLRKESDVVKRNIHNKMLRLHYDDLIGKIEKHESEILDGWQLYAIYYVTQD